MVCILRFADHWIDFHTLKNHTHTMKTICPYVDNLFSISLLKFAKHPIFISPLILLLTSLILLIPGHTGREILSH
jgi:hypothetical protein